MKVRIEFRAGLADSLVTTADIFLGSASEDRLDASLDDGRPTHVRLATETRRAVLGAVNRYPFLADAGVSRIEQDAPHFALREFEVAGMAVLATDYRSASALFALHQGVVGMRPVQIGDATSLSARIERGVLAALDRKSYEPVMARFDLVDWQIREKSDERLTEEQRRPFHVEMRDGAWGPTVFFGKDGRERSVAMEIEKGEVKARGYFATSGDETATIHLTDDTYRVSLTDGRTSMEFVCDENGLRSEDRPTAPREGSQLAGPRA